jgi:enterobactin synthetase component F
VTAPASVVEAIANRAEIDPEAVALVQHETELTYAELWSRSARARDALRAQGVGHGTPVGIHLPRSVDAVTIMLGVLRCGGVVAPLDTRSPVARRDLIVEAATVRLVVGDGTEPGEIPVADLDAGSVPAADVQVFGGDTCCAIATSGTTGRPRVVAIPHRALTNRIAWGQREYPLAAGDRVLHCASIAFDFAMWEIFAPLSAGACVVIASEGHEDDFVATTVAALVDGAATVAHFTPSVLRALVADARGAAALARLRHVFSGGEVLGEDLATRLRGLTDATVWNQYGPAEATVDATFHCVTGQELGPTIPIGRPISGVCAYVVDRAGQLVPDGVSGEIYLGGVGLANGYLGEPALTATRFVPDGLGNTGGRLYRTGDLARRNADGSLVFVGRIDDQVKVRGIRVEPDEVTIALQTHESVRGAAVIAQEIAEGDVALTAYVVGDVTLDEVRSHLDDRLPSYLIPSRLVLVDELPRTANGKLDRVALASIKPRRACAGDDYIAPSSPVEQALAAIWASVLAADQIGMTEEFFEIGGHSLNATRVVGRMREALLLDVSVRDVFQYPTIGGLIETLAARDGYDPVESEAVASLWLRTQNGR